MLKKEQFFNITKYNILSMVKRTDIIKCAKSFLGTLYHHQGRVKGSGIDCVGLIIEVAKELNLSTYDIDGYNLIGDGVNLLEEFVSQCVPTAEPEPGDILVFTIDGVPRHCGIMSTLSFGREPWQNHCYSVIHSARAYKGVTEHVLDKERQESICAAFVFPGVSDV